MPLGRRRRKRKAAGAVQRFVQATRAAVGSPALAAGPAGLAAFTAAGSRARAAAALGRGGAAGADLAYLVNRGAAGAAALLASPTGWMTGLGAQIKLLVEMLLDWWHGAFVFPRATLGAILAALAYFVSPVDVLPEVLPVAGYLDDAAVVMACIRLIQADLRRYARWRRVDLAVLGL